MRWDLSSVERSDAAQRPIPPPPPHSLQAPLRTQEPAGLYRRHPIQASQCVLTDQSFVAALAALGVRLPERPTTAKGQGSKGAASPRPAEAVAGKPGQTTPGWRETDGSPNLNSLQLLLRLLATVGQLQVPPPPPSSLTHLPPLLQPDFVQVTASGEANNKRQSAACSHPPPARF